MLDDRDRQFLFKELDLTHQALANTWQIHMTFFSFFFTANLIVMSWVFTKPDAFQYSGSIWLTSLFWIVFNFAGTIHAGCIGHYGSVAFAKIDKIRNQLAEGSRNIEKTGSFPEFLSIYGAIGMALALIVNIFVWSYIWIRFSQ